MDIHGTAAPAPATVGEDALAEYLKEARSILEHAPAASVAKACSLPDAAEALRWFPLPGES